MEISRAGQALLRSRFLATALFHHAQPRRSTQFGVRALSSWHNTNSRHLFQVPFTSRNYSQQAAASTPPEDNENNSSRNPESSTSSSPPRSKAQRKKSPGNPEAEFDKLLNQQSGSTMSSAQEALNAFENSSRAHVRAGQPHGRREETMREHEQKTQFAEGLEGMSFSPSGGASIIPPMVGQPSNMIGSTNLSYSPSLETQPPYPRLNAQLGRVVDMPSKKGDLAMGLVRLEKLVRTNRIKKMSIAQRFHERGGLKRKRLKSERWRFRFKDGFEHITRRVTRFVNQGW